MPVWRLQTAIGADSPDTRDRFVITPHVNDTDLTTSPEELAEDWADTLLGWMDNSNREVRVTVYDAQGSQPVFPQADVTRNPGAFPSSGCPREIAVCLSFFSERNLPRQRGRLYIPMALLTSSQSFATVRPGTALQEKVGNLATGLANLGGTEVDWSVYSRVDDEARPVTNWYVDNEWDTMRSRGLRPTERTVGTTSEA